MECDLSVIIPLYNSSYSIKRCLDSVTNQSLVPKTIIVVNDGSTDDSEAIIKSLNIAGIIYLTQENKGQATARNLGLNRVNTKYIAFLDSDDYWEAGFTETCIGFLEKNETIDVVNTAQNVKEFGHQLRVNPEITNTVTQPVILDDFFGFWAEHDHIMTGSVVFKTELYNNVGKQLDNLRISQDLEYWAMLAFQGTWAFIPKPLFTTDGMANAVSMGWKKKYSKRRKLCPTVEEWETRLKSRINNSNLESYKKIRGKVALNFVNSMILSKRDKDAFKTIKKYSNEFPKGKLSKLLEYSTGYGWITRFFVFSAIRFREQYYYFKLNKQIV